MKKCLLKAFLRQRKKVRKEHSSYIFFSWLICEKFWENFFVYDYVENLFTTICPHMQRNKKSDNNVSKFSFFLTKLLVENDKNI